MRIVYWNCGGAFQRKWESIAALEPDVAMIAECCQPDRLSEFGFSSSEWIGRLAYKGLGIFGFGEWSVVERPATEQLEWILPVAVSGPLELTVVGVWAMNHRAGSHPVRFAGRSQPEALVDLLDLGKAERPVVVMGDFNNNAIWDTPRKPMFERTRSALESAGLRSLYHELTRESFGAESQPTHWWRSRTESGPTYHIDFAWVTQHLVPRAHLRIGGFSEWVEDAGSDHAALIVDLELQST